MLYVGKSLHSLAMLRHLIAFLLFPCVGTGIISVYWFKNGQTGFDYKLTSVTFAKFPLLCMHTLKGARLLSPTGNRHCGHYQLFPTISRLDVSTGTNKRPPVGDDS